MLSDMVKIFLKKRYDKTDHVEHARIIFTEEKIRIQITNSVNIFLFRFVLCLRIIKKKKNKSIVRH